MLKNIVLSLSLVLSLTSFSVSVSAEPQGKFPKGPEAVLTPGDLCHQPDTYRYPERIAYCERDVSRDLKSRVFEKYDQMGYRTRSMKRQAFKIDHYIPLCAGGSNEFENLWPQHESIYVITDELEALICEKMKEGRLKQKDAVDYIVRAKNFLDEAPAIIREVENL